MTSKELSRALRQLGWTQARLAQVLDVTDGAVSRWLAGKRPIPGPVALAVRQILEEGAK
jgi:predicted transcriptional regulator